jgi:hypothetical protein
MCVYMLHTELVEGGRFAVQANGGCELLEQLAGVRAAGLGSKV